MGARLKVVRSDALVGALVGLVFLISAQSFAFGQTHTHAGEGHAHSTHDAHRGRKVAKSRAGGEVKIGNMKVSVPDVELLDQDGKRVRFYSDLIRDRVVIVSFFFTSCEYVCAMQGSNFAALQKKLGDRLGRDVHLILLTRDPRTDTPAKLKEWGARYGVRPGWTLLTGRAEDVEGLLNAFTGDHVGPVEAHSSGIYLGNDAAASWTYTSGLTPADVLIKTLDRLREEPRRPPAP